MGIDRDKVLAIVRTPPDVALYHRQGNPLFGDLLRRLGSDPSVHAVVLPRTADQRTEIAALALPSVLIPDHAIDAQSLVALADLVISAGGTMNREAAALGIPAYTTFAGRMGAVDEMLVGEGRLEILSSPETVRLEKRGSHGGRVERDPALLLDAFLAALEG
jgi:predicted glycosyltransferase